jgi:hypothetical protein
MCPLGQERCGQRSLRVRAAQQGTRAQRGCTVPAQLVGVVCGGCIGIVRGDIPRPRTGGSFLCRSAHESQLKLPQQEKRVVDNVGIGTPGRLATRPKGSVRGMVSIVPATLPM